MPSIGAIVADWQNYSVSMNTTITARTAAIAPKTISSQIPSTSEFRTTQIPREHIAKLSNFILPDSPPSFRIFRLLPLLPTELICQTPPLTFRIKVEGHNLNPILHHHFLSEVSYVLSNNGCLLRYRLPSTISGIITTKPVGYKRILPPKTTP